MRCARGPQPAWTDGRRRHGRAVQDDRAGRRQAPRWDRNQHKSPRSPTPPTAYHAVRKAVPALGPGWTAVAVGAGGLGHIGIQCLKAMTPAQVIAVDTSEDALNWPRHLRRGPRTHRRQAPGTAGPRPDRHGRRRGLRLRWRRPHDRRLGCDARPGGTYYLVGYGGTVTLPTIQLVLGEITVAGNLIGTNPDLAELVTLASQGKVTLHSTSYPLEAANDAIDDLRHGRIRGRAILIPR